MLYIASDHAGYELKKKIIEYLGSQKTEVEDLGAFSLDPEDDYPDFVVALMKKFTKQDKAILICASGQGMCIASNKYQGNRATQAWSVESAKASRNDDNANILCLASRIPNLDDELKIVETFLATEFENTPKRTRRIEKIETLNTCCS